MTGLRAQVLLGSVVASGCFGAPPSVGQSATGEDSSGSGDASTSSDAASTGETSSTGADTVEPTSATGDAEAEVSGDASSSGEAPCGCAGDEAVCESFESPFDPTALPWAIVGGGVDPVLVDDPTHCGAASLRAHVPPDADTYSVINVGVGAPLSDPGPHGIRTWIYVDNSCTDAATRAMQLKYPSQIGVVYLFEVWMSARGLELRMQNPTMAKVNVPVDVPLGVDTWRELELVVDVSVQPPVGTVLLDGEAVIDAAAGPMRDDNPSYMAEQTVNFGIYRNDAPFPDGCTVYYDDVLVRGD